MHKLKEFDRIESASVESKTAPIHERTFERVPAARVENEAINNFASIKSVSVESESLTPELLFLKDSHYDLPFKFTGLVDENGYFHGTIVPA